MHLPSYYTSRHHFDLTAAIRNEFGALFDRASVKARYSLLDLFVPPQLHGTALLRPLHLVVGYAAKKPKNGRFRPLEKYRKRTMKRLIPHRRELADLN